MEKKSEERKKKVVSPSTLRQKLSVALRSGTSSQNSVERKLPRFRSPTVRKGLKELRIADCTLRLRSGQGLRIEKQKQRRIKYLGLPIEKQT
jgi:hypothetical protein